MKRSRRWIPVLCIASALLSACSGYRVAEIDNTGIETDEAMTDIADQKKDREENNDLPGSAESNTGAADISENKKYVSVAVKNPGSEYYIAEETETEINEFLQFEKIYENTNTITDTEEWFEKNQLSLSSGGGSRSGIHQQWQGLHIVDSFYDDACIYCIYGADYSEGYILNIYDAETGALTCSLDFSEYRFADDYVPEDIEFVQQRIRCAKVRDNILYVSIGHNTYAKSSPHHAYLLAVDLTDFSVIWKSEPLVSNAYNFEIIGDEIICGYGFTDEADYLNQVDIRTGKIICQIPLKSKADYIIQKDSRLYVRTYNTDYIFQWETVQY